MAGNILGDLNTIQRGSTQADDVGVQTSSFRSDLASIVTETSAVWDGRGSGALAMKGEEIDSDLRRSIERITGISEGYNIVNAAYGQADDDVVTALLGVSGD